MSYLGTQPNNVKQNTGLYTPSEILELTKDGSWGGSLELIAEQTASSDSAVNFTSIKENVYDIHLAVYSNINNFSSSGANFALRFYESGVLETASVYLYAGVENKADGNNYTPKSTGATFLFLSMASLTSGEVANGYTYIYNAGNSSKDTLVTTQDVTLDNSVLAMNYNGGSLPQESTVDGFQFTSINGATFDGNIKIFGVKKI
jgi:hypothetical protein